MNRRSIFKALLCSAAAGTLLSSPALAHVATAFETQTTARSLPYLAKAQYLVTLCGRYHAAPAGSQVRSALTDIINAEADLLFGELLDTMPPPASSSEVEQAIRGYREGAIFTDTKLAEMADTVIPLNVMRELIQHHRMPLRPRSLVHWNRFVSRFAPFLAPAAQAA